MQVNRSAGTVFLGLALVAVSVTGELSFASQEPRQAPKANRQSSPAAARSRRQEHKISARGAAEAVSAESENAALKKQLVGQQAQIEALARAVEQLRQALEEHKQTLERALQAEHVPSSQNPNLGQVASLAPVIPAVSAGTEARASLSPLPAVVPSAPATQEQIQQYTAKVEDLGKKMDGALKNLGGFKFSGDLRFRTDGIFRSGNNVAGPVQNIRERYRLRLNFDKALGEQYNVHVQLGSGVANNPITLDNDFAATTTRGPLFITEFSAGYHPNKYLDLRGGKMQEVFADNSRFLFDDDVRFNGFQEIVKLPVASNPLGITRVEFRGGQYILSNPNVVIVPAGSPYLSAGYVQGGKVRDSNLFHQGFGIFADIKTGWSHQFLGDLQWYRNPNQIALASTSAGFPVLVNGNFGLALSGAVAGGGTATTTSGGAIYTARDFQIARLNYRITRKGWKLGEREMPVWLDFQASRNIGTSFLRDAVMGTFNVGDVKNARDVRFMYLFAIKDANAMISQLTDDDLGTGSGVNILTHLIRFDLGLTRFLQWQNLLFIQNERRPSNPAEQFFVPLQRGAARQYRVQSQFQFNF